MEPFQTWRRQKSLHFENKCLIEPTLFGVQDYDKR